MKPISEQDIEQIILLADGKLPPQEAAAVRARIEADPALLVELHQQERMSHLMNDLLNAEPVSVPMPRQDYWNKIQQKIAAEKQTITTQSPAKKPLKIAFWKRLARARRIWAPAAAACIVLGWFCIQNNLAISQNIHQEVETGTGVSTYTMESDSICIEWVTSTYDESSLGSL